MFDLPLAVRKKGTPYYLVWNIAFTPKKILKLATKDELKNFDIKKFCEVVEESLPTPSRHEKELSTRFSLYLTGHLLLGVTRVFAYRATLLLEDTERAVQRINQPWDALSAIEEASTLSPFEQQRQVSPFDHEFDAAEGPPPDFQEDDFNQHRPNEDFQDEEEEEHPRRPQPDQQGGDEDGQPAGAAGQQPDLADDDDEQPAPRQPRKRAARKRARIDTDDEDDDHDRKRKPRKKPARKGAVANIARHEDITMRDDLVESLEDDLRAMGDDLAPLDEEQLERDIEDYPAQINSDTVVIFPRAQPDAEEHEQEPPAAAEPASDFQGQDFVDHDFDYPDRHSPIPPPDADVQQQQEPAYDGVWADNVSRSASPATAVFRPTTEKSFVISNIDLPTIQNLTISPEQARRNRSNSVASLFLDQHRASSVLRTLDSPVIRERLRTSSPSRIIAINIIHTPTPSAPPSSRGSEPPSYAIFNPSRSVTPSQRRDVDYPDHDFEHAAPPDETSEVDVTVSKKPRQKRPPRTHAREFPLTIGPDDILSRDTVYLQKNLRNGKIGKLRARLDNFQNVYKAFLGENVTIEVNDELRDFLDERIGRLDVERARRRATNTLTDSEFRPASRLTQLGSGRATPIKQGEEQRQTPQPQNEQPLQEEEETLQQDEPAQQQNEPMYDPFANDFDNDFRPATPPPAGIEREIPMEEDEPVREQTPPFVRPRSPIPDYQEIEYVEPVPLPPNMEHLISPPRAMPLDLFTSSAQIPFKELSCKFDDTDLYQLILYRCAKEKKVVFKFSDFANRWSRPFIAKQYHNFLLLTEQRKIVSRVINHSVFDSFIVNPTNEFKANLGKIIAHLNRVSASV